ncbi:hypothetical protein ACFWY5_18690 [Nonomuraea sp. NPDC059007]|uniref:hypothetical protein n=1 Tax=Nonomuraea sp. NPDC059007 TaxID=3346692 RepID=UPI0036BE96CA
MDLDQFLKLQDERYDPAARMPWRLSRSNGYHTRIPAGTRVHETRESTDYALALLRAGRVDRAREVLAAVTALQVTDPLDEHYGIWGYFLEEPPHAMGPADWNWADFIGVRLAQVLAVHGDVLDGGVAAALRHAAMSIFRRNVGPRYTNIALLGSVTAAAAGELLPEPFLLEYGRAKLTALLALDAFAEYNSPAYSPFLLEIAERARLVVTDREFLDGVERLRERVWGAVAERFHPGTGQLAGPHARAYDDWLRPELTRYLAEQTGVPIGQRAGVPEGDPTPRLMPGLACPPYLVERFRALPADPVRVRTVFDGETAGTTWLTEDACLGSVNEEFAWVQRRPLLGYWRTPDDPAVVLRARMIHNGHDLSAAWCRQAQDGPRVLAGWWLSYDSGDFHPNLDLPPGSVFPVGDLRLRVTLRGNGVSGRDLGEGRFELAAGGRRAVVHTAAASFLGVTAGWRLAREGDEVAAEVVLYSGDVRPVDFHDAILRAGFAVELLTGDDRPTTSPLTYHLPPAPAPGPSTAPAAPAAPAPGPSTAPAAPAAPGPGSSTAPADSAASGPGSSTAPAGSAAPWPTSPSGRREDDAAELRDTESRGAEGGGGAEVVWSWGDLSVSTPAHPTPFPR